MPIVGGLPPTIKTADGTHVRMLPVKEGMGDMHRKLSAMVACLACLGRAQAAEPPKGPTPVEVKVEVGTKANGLRFVPDHLRFDRGVYYKLTVHNPSLQAHYFTAEALATHAFTRKLEVLDGKGETLVEIHGVIHDLDLQPGTTVAWYFYPMTNGQDLPLYCHKEGHREGGMIGTFTIAGPPPFQPKPDH
jgi:uncharacterized cupredoxin-like copper-binding protein